MRTFLWLKSLETNGEKIKKCMFLLCFPVQLYCIDVRSLLGQHTLGKCPTTKSLGCELSRASLVKAHITVQHKGVEYLRQWVCFNLTRL